MKFSRILDKTAFWICKCDCGKIKEIRGYSLRRGNTRSCGCQVNLKGDKSPKYNHNISKEERKLNRNRHLIPESKKWHKNVFERDNYTCQITGIKGNGNICTHHLESWHANKELRFEISNGITILKPIHILFHKLYGIKFNTRQQFDEFKDIFIKTNLKTYFL